jgi:hypothetical protein
MSAQTPGPADEPAPPGLPADEGGVPPEPFGVPANPAVAGPVFGYQPPVATPRRGPLSVLRDGGPDLTAAGLAVAFGALLGPIAGLIWNLLAPKVMIADTQNGIYWVSPESKTFVAQDGWFAVITAAAGLLTALALFFLVRRGGVGAAVGLAVGGFVGALACLGTGILVGPGDLVGNSLAGTPFAQPLELRATGYLVTWPLVAVLAHLLLHAFFGPSEERAEQPAGQSAVAGWPPAADPGR